MLLVFSDQLQKETEMKEGIGGPFLCMAVFCERVLQEKDNVLSAIRIVDRFMQTIPGSETPEIKSHLRMDVSIVISLKSGDYKGKKQLKITPRSPSGKELPGFSGPVIFEGEDKGVNVVVRYLFEGNEEGLYWFDVELDGKSLTKMPLRIIYQKMGVTSTTTEPMH